MQQCPSEQRSPPPGPHGPPLVHGPPVGDAAPVHFHSSWPRYACAHSNPTLSLSVTAPHAPLGLPESLLRLHLSMKWKDLAPCRGWRRLATSRRVRLLLGPRPHGRLRRGAPGCFIKRAPRQDPGTSWHPLSSSCIHSGTEHSIAKVNSSPRRQGAPNPTAPNPVKRGNTLTVGRASPGPRAGVHAGGGRAHGAFMCPGSRRRRAFHQHARPGQRHVPHPEAEEHAAATDEARGSWPKSGLEQTAMTVRRNGVGRPWSPTLPCPRLLLVRGPRNAGVSSIVLV